MFDFEDIDESLPYDGLSTDASLRGVELDHARSKAGVGGAHREAPPPAAPERAPSGIRQALRETGTGGKALPSWKTVVRWAKSGEVLEVSRKSTGSHSGTGSGTGGGPSARQLEDARAYWDSKVREDPKGGGAKTGMLARPPTPGDGAPWPSAGMLPAPSLLVGPRPQQSLAAEPPLRPPRLDGVDAVWPVTEADVATFVPSVVEALWMKDFCLIQMNQPEDLRLRAQEAVARAEESLMFSIPYDEFEEAFLGRDHSSKVVCGEDMEAGLGCVDDMWADCVGLLGKLGQSLKPWTREALGFEAWECCKCPMLRTSVKDAGERKDLKLGRLGGLDRSSSRELVERHLEFFQRRKLCMMYWVHNDGGSVELRRRDADAPLSSGAGSDEASVDVPLLPDTLLVFRHDLLDYSYRPRGGGDLVVQAWLMEEPQLLCFDSFNGDHAGMQAVLGEPPLPPEAQVSIMGGGTALPGWCRGIAQTWCMFSRATDGFVEIPSLRWDHTMYYSEVPMPGKSKARHVGFLKDEYMMCFDNSFFNMHKGEAAWLPPSQRVLLEVTMEAFMNTGFTKESVRGAPIASYLACGDLEWNYWMGYNEDPENWAKSGNNNAPTCGRLAYFFDLTGNCNQCDTACSAALVAADSLHAALRLHKVEVGLSAGLVQHTSPFSMIGLSMSGMLGASGRSRSFDASANGYNRGEGVTTLVYKASDNNPQTVQDRLGCILGSYINQDGRSASLTAPNGPSQQACVRGSLRDAGLQQEEVCVVENHGTGTALGDPIECGSIIACFRKRAAPVIVASGKCHIGHMEQNAGHGGILKVLLQLQYMFTPGQDHLYILNHHIDINGFPGLFPVEMTDVDSVSFCSGLNAFGFGGTNSRADLWANCSRGHRDASRLRLTKFDCITVACPRCLGLMCWLCRAAVPENVPKGRHCCTIPDDLGSSEYCSMCNGGNYAYAEITEDALDHYGERVYVTGTWDAWSAPREMLRTSEGVYACVVTLGETRRELFRLAVDNDDSKTIYPIVHKADQKARIRGPGTCEHGNSWLLDGVCDGTPAGATYQITFSWSKRQSWIAWEPVDMPSSALAPPEFEHTYSILGTLTNSKPVMMQRHPQDDQCWMLYATGTGEEEEFLFMRDGDPSQLIYPLQAVPIDGMVPVVGPDEGGSAGRFRVRANMDEAVSVVLHIDCGVITVAAGETTWRSTGTKAYYFVAGSWLGGRLTLMEADAEDAAGPAVHRCQFVMGPSGQEEFQIVVNQSPTMRLYPAAGHSLPGHSPVCGPDADGRGRLWEVSGQPGQVMEITLDLAAADYTRMVACHPHGGWSALSDGRPAADWRG